MPNFQEVECLVYGRVTRVMFRDFVCRRARRLGLAGTVQNLPDRSVRVIARGEEAPLRELISYLKRGPIFSQVEKVETVWRPPRGQTQTGFQIIYD